MEEQKLREFINKQSWIFAKTYANKAPHEYIIRGRINGTDEDVLKYRKDVRRIANDVGLDNNILVSLLIKPRQSFEEWSDVVVFYKNVIKEGATLYE